MSIFVPGVGEVQTLDRDDIRALLEMPKTIARFTNALATFSESVERFDRMVKRVDRMTRPMEAPLDIMADRLEKLGTLLNPQQYEGLPELLETLQRNGPSALELFSQSQAQLAAFAASLERMRSAFEQFTPRLPDLPGLAAWRRPQSGEPGSGEQARPDDTP